MDRAWLLSVLLLAGSALAVPVHAQESPTLTPEERAWLSAHGPVRFVGNDGFAPFILYGERGVPQGINRDFAQLMSVHLGIEFEFVRASNFSNTLEALRNGSADFAGNLNVTPERLAFLAFTEPYAEARTVFWARTGYQLPPELVGVRIAVVKNTASVALVAERYPLAVVRPVEDVRVGLRDVEEGRADAFLGADAPSAFLAREDELFGLSPVGPPFDSREYRFAVPKEESVLLGILSKGLASITPEQRSAIFVKWTGFDLTPGARDVKTVAPAAIPAWAQATVGIVVGIALLLGAWSIALRRQVANRTSALRESEARFERALAGSADGIWDLDIPARRVTTSQRSKEMLGLPGDAVLTQEEWRERIHPDDRERALKDLADHLQGTTAGFDTQYRVRHEDGDYRWVRVRGAGVRGSGAPPTRVAGTMTDITERYVAAQALQRSQARFQALTSAAQDAILFTDLDGRISYMNPAAERMFGIMGEDGSGRKLATLVAERHRDALASWLTATSARGAPLAGHAVEITGLRADATEFPLEVSIASWEENDRVLFGAILRDVTERKQHEDALRVAKEQAEQASRAKSRFLANMSHEIRTPMNAVIGLSHLLERTDLTAEQREFVATIRSSGDHLLSLINDVLDLSRIEADKVHLDERPFDLRQCLLASVDLIRPRAREKGLDVAVVLSPDLPATLFADEGRLRQVLVNLLSNAVKFTPRGIVRLEADTDASATGASLRLRVIDSGIGMSPQQVAALFEPFQQGDASITRAYGGSGLGLSITKRLVDLMRGEIRVVSHPSKGSSFEVMIPIMKRGAPEAPVTPPPQATQPERPPLRILVAEDIPVNQRIAGLILQGMGHNVQFAANGQEAVHMAAAGLYDAILMDVQMPVMDGLKATTCIRTALAREQQPRILGLSAHALEDERRRALDVGMDDYLTKPIRPEELEAALRLVPPLTAAMALDARRLDELRDQIGQEGALLDRILVEALATAEQSSRELEAALAAHDPSALARAAHKLKGAARLIGAQETDLAVTRLEELARSPRPDAPALTAAVEATQHAIERLREALSARSAAPQTLSQPGMKS